MKAGTRKAVATLSDFHSWPSVYFNLNVLVLVHTDFFLSLFLFSSQYSTSVVYIAFHCTGFSI